MTTSTTVVNRNDEIREEILQYLFNLHKNARGVKSTQVSISILEKVMKDKGCKRQEVVSNLDYLIQTGWVVQVEEPYTFNVGKRVITNSKTSYKISDLGTDYFEGASKFQRTHRIPEININNINGVTVVGDGNYVYNQYSELYNNLDVLTHQIFRSDAFSDKDKLHALAEIQTIKSQLSKPEPDRSTVRKAWERIKSIAEGIGTLTALERVAELIHILL